VSDVKEPYLVALFDLVWRRVKDEMEAGPIIEGAELRPSQRRVLGRTPLEGIRVTALAERTQMTAQALGTIAEVLVLAGYLERVPDPHDRPYAGLLLGNFSLHSGFEIQVDYDYIGALQPGVKVLFMSGYTQGLLDTQGVVQPGVNLIEKPFTETSLLTKLRQVVTADGAPDPPG